MENDMKENPTFWQNRPYCSYRQAEDEQLQVWCRGLLTRDGGGSELLVLGREAWEGRLDYNCLHGGFCVVVYHRTEKGYLFFGDNAGSQYLFFDAAAGEFSDSFLALCRRRRSLQPDLSGLASMLDFEQTLGEGTAVLGIGKTQQDSFYRLGEGGTLRAFSKELRRFSDMPRDLSLDDCFAPLLRAAEGEKSCAICTGGTDSRAVLSALARHDAVPELLLTAHPGNPDILPAKAVAGALGKELRLVDFEPNESGWIEKGFCFLDGAYDAVLSYRHLKKARYVRTLGCSVEYGGVGGELYKNSYCNFVRNWRARSRRERLEALLEDGAAIRASSLYAEELRRAEEDNEPELRALIESAEDGLLTACNRLGYSLLCIGSGAITNGYAAVCCKIDPLMDRSLAASASQESLFSHRMHRWQRRQIAQLAPQLAELPTDQGYSCSLKRAKLIEEQIKKLGFFADRALARFRRALGMSWSSREQRYWDEDYLAARRDPLWQECIRVCRQRGILAPDADGEAIPLAMTGKILQLGLLFSPSFNELYDRWAFSFLEEEAADNKR